MTEKNIRKHEFLGSIGETGLYLGHIQDPWSVMSTEQKSANWVSSDQQKWLSAHDFKCIPSERGFFFLFFF